MSLCKVAQVWHRYPVLSRLPDLRSEIGNEILAMTDVRTDRQTETDNKRERPRERAKHREEQRQTGMVTYLQTHRASEVPARRCTQSTKLGPCECAQTLSLFNVKASNSHSGFFADFIVEESWSKCKRAFRPKDVTMDAHMLSLTTLA